MFPPKTEKDIRFGTEYALATLLSNPTPEEITLKRIEHILKYPIDWNKLFLIALAEKTAFIICNNLLKYHYFWLVPDQLWLFWNAAYMGNIKRNELLLYYYDILTKKFFQKNIFVIPNRGIILLTSIYKEMIGARLLHDLDFMTEKKYLSSIDKVLHNLDFKKIYINDRDFLANSTNMHNNDILYSKYENSTYVNCDFCCGIEENQVLFTFLINYIQEQQEDAFDIVQLMILYMVTAESWNGTYYIPNVKHYTLARLVDLHLFQRLYVNSKKKSTLAQIARQFQLHEMVHEVNISLDFLKREGYLT